MLRNWLTPFYLLMIALSGASAWASTQFSLGTCEDRLASLGLHEPWPHVEDGISLPEPSRRMVTAELQRLGEWIRTRVNSDIRLVISPLDWSSLRESAAPAKLNTTDAFLMRKGDRLTYVEPWQTGDQELIALSDVPGSPRQAFRLALLDGTATVRSVAERAAAPGAIQPYQYNAHMSAFASAHHAAFRRLIGRPAVYNVVHTHPVVPVRVTMVAGGLRSPLLDIEYALSDGDIEFARDLSIRYPGVLILMSAVVPIGVRYSALFLDGKDITADIESHLVSE